MTEDQLAAIRARSSRITPAPWLTGRSTTCNHRGTDTYNIWSGSAQAYGVDITDPCAHIGKEDAEFIASAPQDVATLLAEVERLTAIQQEIEATVPKGAPCEATEARRSKDFAREVYDRLYGRCDLVGFSRSDVEEVIEEAIHSLGASDNPLTSAPIP